MLFPFLELKYGDGTTEQWLILIFYPEAGEVEEQLSTKLIITRLIVGTSISLAPSVT